MYSVKILDHYIVSVYTDKYSFEDRTAQLEGGIPDLNHDTLYTMRSCKIIDVRDLPSPPSEDEDEPVYMLGGYVTVSIFPYSSITVSSLIYECAEDTDIVFLLSWDECLERACTTVLQLDMDYDDVMGSPSLQEDIREDM